MASLNFRKVTLGDLVPPDLVLDIDGQEIRIPGKALTVEAMARLSEETERFVTEGENPYAVLASIKAILEELAGVRFPPLTVAQTLQIVNAVVQEGTGLGPLAQQISESLSGTPSAQELSGLDGLTKK